ncbi:MAG: extracellular solute-binding protein [Planctomycetota bacterium]
MELRRMGTLFLISLLAIGLGCSKKEGGQKLVLYSAGDSLFTKSTIDDFKKESGITVEVATDTEVTRGIALRVKLEKQKDNPRADVYWNNELVNTIVLGQKGLLAQYKSPSAEEIPREFADPQGYWTAFGARARVFIVNTERVKPEDEPKGMKDMLDPKWKGKIGIAKPDCGTTATHAAALFELLGEEEAKKFYAGLKANEVVLCNGNGHVKDQVAAGELAWGWTDTNDTNVAIRDGKPVKAVYPDQGEEGQGTLLIPHSVCLIKGGPNPENAKKFIDFLLRKDREQKLAESISVQIPVRPGVSWPQEAEKHFIMDIKKIKAFNAKIDWTKVASRYDDTVKYLSENFIK